MKKGFTMIELIFVIVIIGILAAVAIPKLTATRDDAKISKMAANIATLVSDAGSYYTSQGQAKWESATWSKITNVQLGTDENDTSNGAKDSNISTTAFINASSGVNCFKVTTTTDGNLSISENNASASTSNSICSGAKDIAGNLIGTHSFGGQGVVR